MSPRLMTTQLQSSMGSPVEVASPQGTRVGYSFDSDETEPYAVHESRPWWQLLWGALFDRVHHGADPGGRVPNVTHAHCSCTADLHFRPRSDHQSDHECQRHVLSIDHTMGETLKHAALSSRQAYHARRSTPTRTTFSSRGRPRKDFCKREMEPDQRTTPPYDPWSVKTLFNASVQDIQLRPVICVVNAKYWRLQDTYLPTLQPMYYCSAIVVYGYGVHGDGKLVWKYPTAVGYLRALKTMNSTRQLLHRGNAVPVYAALGGAREDSANLSEAVSSNGGYLAAYVASEVVNTSTPWTGVNVDWDYPGDSCNRASSTRDLFFTLVQDLKTEGLNVMITVPPVQSRFSTYSLDQVAGKVDYIIIKTHTHTAPRSLFNVVRCSGDQSVAADVFNEALNMLSDFDRKSRLGYSISVATFADELALIQRMNLTYSDNMAMAPVAVFDVDLDDFYGRCGSGMSPLVRAIATGPG
ncbi:hypothetical protein MTO96_015753 [Rhipicephalus appendiculatus]